MRQHLSAKMSACGASLGKRSANCWARLSVGIKENKVKRSRKRLDDFVASPNRKSTYCERLAVRRLSCAILCFSRLRSMLMTRPPSGPTEAASKWCCIRWRCQSPICVAHANCGPVCLRFPLSQGSRLSSLRECSGSGHRASGRAPQAASGKCGFPGSFDAHTRSVVTRTSRILYNGASPCQIWILNSAAE